MSETRRSISWLDVETARVVWERPEPVEIVFARLSETLRADAVTALVTVRTTIADIGRVAGPIRLNLYSSSAIDSLRRACQNVTDIPDWSRVLGDSIAAVLERFARPETTTIDITTDTTPPGWLLPPLVEAEGYTVLYARGGSGKSYLAVGIAVSVASGQPVLGLAPRSTGNVVYLDWESSASVLTHRIRRVCNGIETTNLEHRIDHVRMTGPFAARRAAISEHLATVRPALVVIDSKGGATTGSPESSEGIIDLARAVRYLDAPVLLIDHISKATIRGDDPDMAFGSQYVEASARLAWSLQTEHGRDMMTLRLRNTKANNHARAGDLTLAMHFVGDAVVFFDIAESDRQLKQYGATEPEVVF
jgi:hypothetical protein